MSDPRTVATLDLYRRWRGGDPAAGQGMAQRFSDWYYAVTAARLGDAHGRAPLQRCCTRFQQGIVTVAKDTELVGWAHGILAEELQSAGGRIAGGDFPNQLTGGRSPTELLGRARDALTSDEVRLLAHAYDATYPLAEVTREAELLGGMPLAVLKARYALKRWLRDNAGIGFSEVPDAPNLDYAPLPLYEAGRMQNALEEAGFEKWLLTNMGLCKDIAEFATFALALRAGAFRAPLVVPKEATKASASARPAPASTPAASTPAASTPAGSTLAASTPAASTPAASTPAASTPAASTLAAPPAATRNEPSAPAADAKPANTLLLVVGALLVLGAVALLAALVGGVGPLG